MTGDNEVRVWIASKDELDVREFRLRAPMSELFRIEVEAVSTNANISHDQVVGREASFSIIRAGATQTWTGIAIEIEQVRSEEDGLATYRLVLAPRAWLLTQRKNYRIFQFLSEVAIARKILQEWGIAHQAFVDETLHKARKLRVQYGETDFAFLSRMMEDAGVSFYFEPSEEGSVLVLHDEPQQRDSARSVLTFHDEPQVTERNFATDVHVLQAVRPGRMTIGDLDYRRTSTEQPRLSAAGGLPRELPLEQFDYEPGAFLYEAPRGTRTPAADDRGASRSDERLGRRKVENRLLGKRSSGKRVRLLSDALELAPGSLFRVSNHPHRALGNELMVVCSSLAGRHDETWRVQVEAVSTGVPYRPELTHTAPKARLESATVVGPVDEEIHTDEYGRVRVHFHWDRESRRDDASSCWLPTSQAWAGTRFGGTNIPRVGQEVLVGFLNADPDRPVVVGRVYTEMNPVPDKLPQFKEVSGLFSESTPRLVMGAADGDPAATPSSLLEGGTPMSPSEINTVVTTPGPFQAASPTGQNHTWSGSGIKMQDYGQREMLYLQAQRDFNLVVNNCWRGVVQNRRACLVGTDDQLEVGNCQATDVYGEQGIKIGTDQYLTVRDGRRLEEINAECVLEVGAGGIDVTAVDKGITLAARSWGKTVTIKSDERIELVVKDSFIVIEAGSVTVQSAKVNLQPQDGGGQ